MTEEQVLRMIRKRADELGTISALAKEAGVSVVYVSDVLRGRRGIGPELLRHFGLEKVVTYRKIRRAE